MYRYGNKIDCTWSNKYVMIMHSGAYIHTSIHRNGLLYTAHYCGTSTCPSTLIGYDIDDGASFTGDCIGLPYSSVERFPVIPTYGLEELTGWFYSSDPLPSDQRHLLGRHVWQGERMFPRSVMIQDREVWLRLTPFISNKIHIPVKNVPLSGVELLVS